MTDGPRSPHSPEPGGSLTARSRRPSSVGTPFNDRYTLIRMVRTQVPEYVRRVQAAAVTVSAGTEDRLRVISAGYQMHIPKPVDPAELIEATARLAEAARASGGAASS